MPECLSQDCHVSVNNKVGNGFCSKCIKKTKNGCGICVAKVKRDDNGISCDFCKSWFHCECLDISMKLFQE